MKTEVIGLYCGSIKFLPPNGEKTGIYKDIVESVNVDEQGIIGDLQADRRFHGGPEKALHQYSIHSYEKIIAAFSDLKKIAIPGSIGENLSSNKLDDANVHIGDIYCIGSVKAQVSQPRSPCWKINARYDEPRLAKLICNQAITGWYYRVLEPGMIVLGDKIQLVERQCNSVSIREFTQITYQHPPEIDLLKQLAAIPALNQQWRKKLQQRYEYLSNSPQARG